MGGFGIPKRWGHAGKHTHKEGKDEERHAKLLDRRTYSQLMIYYRQKAVLSSSELVTPIALGDCYSSPKRVITLLADTKLHLLHAICPLKSTFIMLPVYKSLSQGNGGHWKPMTPLK